MLLTLLIWVFVAFAGCWLFVSCRLFVGLDMVRLVAVNSVVYICFLIYGFVWLLLNLLLWVMRY